MPGWLGYMAQMSTALFRGGSSRAQAPAASTGAQQAGSGQEGGIPTVGTQQMGRGPERFAGPTGSSPQDNWSSQLADWWA